MSKTIDLNLLHIFNAVYEEKNVTRAAKKLNLNPSTISKGIIQLRLIFNDTLFLRSAQGMMPTHRAIEISGQVRNSIEMIEGLINPRASFNPSTSSLQFNIGASDYVSYVLLPSLMKRVQVEAPFLKLAVFPIDTGSADQLLMSGNVDVALATATTVTYPLFKSELFSDKYVCAMRTEHETKSNPISIEQFEAGKHLAMPRQNGGREIVLHDYLQKKGIKRNISLQVPNMLSIPAVLEESDLIATLAERVAKVFSIKYSIKIVAHPFDMEPFSISQVWHRRNNSSESHAWLRGIIYDVSKSI